MLVRVHDFINKNRKLTTKFEALYTIIELTTIGRFLKSRNGKTIKRNILHLKLFTSPTPWSSPLSWAKIVEQGEGTDPADPQFNNDEASNANLATTIGAVLN